MSISRRPMFRHLLAGALLAGSAASAAAQPDDDEEQVIEKANKPLKILILGGTGFLGPWEVEAALARGHEVTLFNRGETGPELFPELETLRGDRDPDVEDGLSALEGREWDVVIDNSGYYPRMVNESAKLLAENVGHYVFVSDITVYADNSEEGQDEDAAVAEMEDRTLETMGPNSAYYGPLKALCEKAVSEVMPGRVTIVRPGYIVGPGDPTHRFAYWPLRIREGGEVAVPGAPDDPVQVIDVRDLARWIIHAGENRIFGRFNVCGPAEPLTMKELVETCREVSGSDAKFTWIDVETLEQNPDAGFPIWKAYAGDTKGYHTRSNRAAIHRGLEMRPLRETIADTLTWFDEQPEEMRRPVMEKIPPAWEATLLAAPAAPPHEQGRGGDGRE